MIVIIQCAASKRPGAGTFKTESGDKVIFVAHPAKAPPLRESGYVYAKPDDLAHDGVSWREKLLHYNEASVNPNGLYKAYELYKNQIYEELVNRIGIENTFILSAGWGLIRADFLIPYYDITFSSAVRKSAPHKYRHARDFSRNFCHLPKSSGQPVIVFGGKDYLSLFCSLTDGIEQRLVFYNSAIAPRAPGCKLRKFETRIRTNWHYECAKRFLEGVLPITD